MSKTEFSIDIETRIPLSHRLIEAGREHLIASLLWFSILYFIWKPTFLLFAFMFYILFMTSLTFFSECYIHKIVFDDYKKKVQVFYLKYSFIDTKVEIPYEEFGYTYEQVGNRMVAVSFKYNSLEFIKKNKLVVWLSENPTFGWKKEEIKEVLEKAKEVGEYKKL